MAKKTKISKNECHIGQLLRTRLFPDEGDEWHPLG